MPRGSSEKWQNIKIFADFFHLIFAKSLAMQSLILRGLMFQITTAVYCRLNLWVTFEYNFPRLQDVNCSSLNWEISLIMSKLEMSVQFNYC